MKVAFISIHPAPYRDDTLQLLSEKKDIQLDVYNMADVPDNHKEWEYKNNSKIQHFLKKACDLPIVGLTNFDIFKRVKNHDILIICSYYPGTSLLALIYAWVHKVPYVYCCDAVKDGKKFKLIKKLLTKKIYGKAKSLWVPGGMSKDYYINQGVQKDKIFEGFYTNDSRKLLSQMKKAQIDSMKKSLNIGNNSVTFIFVGKLIKSRNISLLLSAFNDISDQYDTRLIIIGDGIDQDKVSAEKKRNKYIIHIPEVNYNDLHSYYAIADAYVHPGVEPYSLALVEGIVAGLPAISNRDVGSSQDFIINNENGFRIGNNKLELVSSMKKICEKNYNKEKVVDMQNFIINERNIEWSSNQLYKAINY